MANSTSFDPYQQSFTLLDENGNPFNVTIPDVDSFVQYNAQTLINFSCQLGACMVLVFVLLLLTKENKRTSPIFIVNTLALVLNTIGNATGIAYFVGPFNEAYAYFADDYSQAHTGDYATSVVSTFMWFLVMVCVEISLCLQTRAVCVTLRKAYRDSIFAISLMIATASVAVRLAYSIENAKAIVALQTGNALNSLQDATTITTTITICWFCAVFVTKLAFALHQRKKLGLGQFGPMQIIFIMGCQTLFIPVIFVILQYTTQVQAMSSWVLTSVCIFLPLSSLWASASLDSRFQDSKGQNYGGKVLPTYATESTAHTSGKSFNKPISPSHNSTTHVSSSAASPRRDSQNMVFRDLEAQGLAGTGEFVGKE
ncbi:pheromone alpha factor receptor, partial [Lecanoromycetidae sp. Uapishka_2]